MRHPIILVLSTLAHAGYFAAMLQPFALEFYVRQSEGPCHSGCYWDSEVTLLPIDRPQEPAEEDSYHHLNENEFCQNNKSPSYAMRNAISIGSIHEDLLLRLGASALLCLEFDGQKKIQNIDVKSPLLSRADERRIANYILKYSDFSALNSREINGKYEFSLVAM